MEDNERQHMTILLPFAVLFLLILGSILVDFKVIDVLYLIVLIVFLVKYILIKKTANKNV